MVEGQPIHKENMAVSTENLFWAIFMTKWKKCPILLVFRGCETTNSGRKYVALMVGLT